MKRILYCCAFLDLTLIVSVTGCGNKAPTGQTIRMIEPRDKQTRKDKVSGQLEEEIQLPKKDEYK